MQSNFLVLGIESSCDETGVALVEVVEHHRGAIAMSRIVLRETKDSKVRMMANKAVAEQTREVGELEGWLKAHGKRAQ